MTGSFSAEGHAFYKQMKRCRRLEFRTRSGGGRRCGRMKTARRMTAAIYSIPATSPTTNGDRTVNSNRQAGVSSATFYKWKAKYGALDVSLARRLKI